MADVFKREQKILIEVGLCHYSLCRQSLKTKYFCLRFYFWQLFTNIFI